MRRVKVIVVGSSRQTRGGITSVIKAYENSDIWDKFNCVWVESHIDSGIFNKLFYFMVGLIKFLFEIGGADIVHIHHSEPVSTIRKIPFILLTKLFRKKLIMHFHSFSADTTICGKFRDLYKFVFKKSDFVIVLSEYWKDLLYHEFELCEKVHVIYNPCLPLKDNIVTREKTILFAGTITSRKGYSVLLKAFSMFNKKIPGWNLVFAGNGEIEKARREARDYGIIDNTKFLGWVSGTDKEKVFESASIFCLPSFAEGFPMAVLDAVSFGVPVITTPVGGILDAFEHKSNALIFEPGDSDALCLCLEELALNNSLRESIKLQAFKTAKDRFEIQTLNTLMEKLYLRLLMH
ncbi:glycosyltransferase family 4 protein [Alteromonas sp. LMIT006]|uniref:glycosyltransferase family 4 protein n=1 Tax=Alteromonadaceae TaxID=72275 RepID=UPI0020CA6ED5|nr:glycosyltransferase family 4 protein [Alteromonas sp. LMIT006]UTP71920.1 glycosyltransferase family 4 protein [Alteromonas sp. LMIT006]